MPVALPFLSAPTEPFLRNTGNAEPDRNQGCFHWEEFSKEFENKFPKRDVYFVYKRLERTGFISEVTETESVEENTGSLDIDSIGYKTESELSRFNEMVLKNI